MTAKPFLFRATVVTLILTAGLTLLADTRYVDKNFGPGGDGTKTRPFNIGSFPQCLNCSI